MNVLGFELTDGDVLLLGAVGGGAVVFATYRLLLSQDKIARRAQACATFRGVFHSELVHLYPTVTAWPENIDAFLKGKFPALQTAVGDFRPSLSWFGKWRFDKAWLSFYSAYPRKTKDQCYHHYLGSYSTGTQAEATAKAQALFHSNVKRLLSFARET